jgi:hypothetical protein
LPYHGLWDAAYQGFGLSPAASDMGASFEMSNNSAYLAGLAYSRKIHFLSKEESWVSPWTRTYKMRLNDNILRSTVIEIWKKNPIDTLLLYTVYKPLKLLALFLSVLQELPAWVFFASAVLVFLVALIAERTSIREMPILGAAVAATIISSAPNIWAYPAPHAIADFTVTAVMVIFYALVLAVSSIFLRLRAI